MAKFLKKCANGLSGGLAALIALAALAAGIVNASAADIPTMAAPAAHAKATAGELLLVDVRTPDEWKSTGVPKSAHAITMHQKPEDFLAQLRAATGGNPNKTVAIICRTGNRTSALAEPLTRAGFPNVVNVIEGVVGGPRGTGWMKRGLPMRPWTPADTGPELAQQ